MIRGAERRFEGGREGRDEQRKRSKTRSDLLFCSSPLESNIACGVNEACEPQTTPIATLSAICLAPDTQNTLQSFRSLPKEECESSGNAILRVKFAFVRRARRDRRPSTTLSKYGSSLRQMHAPSPFFRLHLNSSGPTHVCSVLRLFWLQQRARG